MLTWFEQRSLRFKLALGFGLLLGLMLIGSATALLSHERSLQTVNAFLEHEKRIHVLSLESGVAMANARRYEKEFLLKQREYSFEEAKSRYATQVASQLASVRDNLQHIGRLSQNREIQNEILAIDRVTRLYEAGFLRVVELYGRQGHVNKGLEGQFRQRVHAIEAMLQSTGTERLRVDLLSMRRHEKDFIQRGQTRYSEAVQAAVGQFKDDIRLSQLPSALQQTLRRELEQYAQLFAAYVATDAEIEALSREYLTAVHQIEPQLEQLAAHAEQAVAATRHALEQQKRATSLSLLGTGAIALLLGGLVATFIVRNMNATVAACVNFASQLARGDWSARLSFAGASNEFARLAGALNGMAADLQQVYQRESTRALELARANRTLRTLSRCNELLVRSESEPQLLQAVCECIVSDGGHGLAWVAFVNPDQDKRLRPAAYAGNGGECLHSLELSWADASQSIYGRAIADNQAQLIRHAGAMADPCHLLAQQCGYGSGLALPLRSKDGVLGILCIHASGENAFDDEEIRLLQELADDLGFGVLGQREIWRREKAERALFYQGNFDRVTGLANRNLFGDRVRQALMRATRGGHQVAVLMLSLDRFKIIKDSLGPDAGDAVLKHVGRALTMALREADTVARLAGDEFAVALTDLAATQDVTPVALKLLAAVVKPITLQGRNVYFSASVGISLFPKDGVDAESLLQQAEVAMTSAKAVGGNAFRYYAAEMNERTAAIFALESELRHAIAHDELRVYFQPRVYLASGAMSGAEALVRWHHPVRGLVSPAEFIPIAEDTGLILPLGIWMIESVCRQQRAWLDAGLPVLPVAVNLSARQFRQENLTQVITAALQANQLDGRYLEVEITESTLMDNSEEAVAVLHNLRAAGIKLALDDFGTGHSSLNRLRRLPVDHLKIDQSFVRNLTSDPEDAAICTAIIGLAHDLHMTVIAEGVETEGQAIYLRAHLCDEMQGYYFSRPVPAADFEAMLAPGKTLALPALHHASNRTLLLVDDEPHILSALKRLFLHDGYHVLSADNGKEGLELLSRHTVQVIVSDQIMPEMNGCEFLGRVRELYPDTIRMVLSGYSDLRNITDTVNRGAIYKYLSKPWNSESLRSDVREAFHYYEAARKRA